MNMQPALPPPEVAPPPAYLVIGAVVRSARDNCEMTLQGASDAVSRASVRYGRAARGSAVSQLSRMERGEGPPWADLVEDLLRCYGYDPIQAEGVIAMACRWVVSQPYVLHDIAPGWSARLGICERAATSLRFYASTRVPVAFRTPDYAAALGDSQVAWGDCAERPRAHHLRPEVVSMVLDWSVLERLVGGPTVMATQLSSLRDLVYAGRLRLRIVPKGSGALCPFSAAMTEMVVHKHRLFVSEGPSATYVSGPEEGKNCALQLDAVADAALTEPQSLDLLTDAIQCFDRQPTTAVCGGRAS